MFIKDENLKQMNLRKATAIVVNDDVTQLNLLTGLLNKDGIDAHGYESAEAAFSMMNPCMPPDIIITDLYMPGIDGWRFCRLLRSPEYKAFNQVPILVVSATFAGDEASRITADLGANAFLSSPVNGKRFITLARSLLAGERPKDQLCVLIVEDSKTLAGLLKKSFKQHGYRADTALNLGSAVNAFENESYDVAVIDYHLPDGNGDTLLKQFKNTQPNIVCIMMTTDPSPELALAWMHKGAAAYLRKPFKPEYLIEQCVRARREQAMLSVEDRLEQRTQELHKSSETLKKKSEQQRLLLDTINIQIWYLTDIATYGRLNRAHAQFIGLDIKDIAHKPMEYFFAKDVADTCIASNIRVFKTRRSVHTEEWIPNGTGERRLIAITKTPELDENGNVAFVVCAGEDITERKKAEDELHKLQQMEKNQSLSRMAGAIAHLFNNQLTVVIGNLELLQEDLPPEPNLFENLCEARQAANRAAETSRLMLTFLGQNKGNPILLDLAHTCRMCLAGSKVEIPDSVNVISNLPEHGPAIQADQAQVYQVIEALLINALESLEKIGSVQVAVHIVKADEMAQTHRFPVEWEPSLDSYACLEVTDTGQGMAPETINKIFDPFYTNKFTGRGLGLAVALGTVKSFGGCIIVKSELGQGSVFRAFWPMSSQTFPSQSRSYYPG